MSINPVLAEDATAKNELFPLPQPGEVFVLKRDGMAFVASNSDRKLSGKGKLFLTSKRLVFLRDGKPEKHKGFTSVELPLHLLSGSTRGTAPDFKQPIFGANYLEGKVEPAANAPNPLAGTTKWSLTFNKGGCQTFLKAFYRLHKRAVADPTNAGLDPAFAQQLQMGPQAAFYDPSDPSLIYLVQPVPQNVPGYQSPPPPPQQQQQPVTNPSLYPPLDIHHQQQQQPQYYAPPPQQQQQQPMMNATAPPPQYGLPPSYGQQPQYCPPQYAPQQQYQPPPQQPYQPPPQYGAPSPSGQYPPPQYQTPQYAPYQPPQSPPYQR